MTHNDIPGWFDFHTLYDEMVQNAPPKAVFVEVGCWLGRSTAYLAQKIKESKKNINLFAVDVWGPTAHASPEMLETLKKYDNAIRHVFLDNMKKCGVDHLVTPIHMTSLQAAKLFGHEAVDFVFIDTDHTEFGTTAEINDWHPKIKPGGTLAGHDFAGPHAHKPVQRAVNLTLPNATIHKPSCWVYKKPLFALPNTPKFDYTQIPGWFDFQNVYDEMVNKAPKKATFVEVGCWMGKSTAYLAQKIKESKKNITLYAVDPFTPGHDTQLALDTCGHPGSFYYDFLDNLHKCGVEQHVKPLKMTAHEASKLIPKESVDFLFCDHQKDYNKLRNDMQHLFNLVKPGGYIGGHDFRMPHKGVIAVVNEFFCHATKWHPASWLVKKEPLYNPAPAK